MKNTTQFRLLDAFICLPFLIVPLLLHLPYRVNIFLSWEGAYRLYLGQVPYKDFGLPLGFGYWIIPALFFKMFGPTFLSLVKAQVFINLLSLLCLRGILYNFKVKPVVVSISLLVFCLTYMIYNFWPWYNHSVIVFEMASLYFLTSALNSNHRTGKIIHLVGSALLAFLTMFTKQDVGGICLVLCLAILAYHFIFERDYFPIAIFLGSYLVIAAVVMLPFMRYDFFYWFNYGQPPHHSRLGIGDLLGVFFGNPGWEKTYLFLFVLIIMMGGREKIKSIIHNWHQAVLAIITLAMIGQAIVTQVTSPLPGNITYFHAFGIPLIITLTNLNQWIDRFKNAVVFTVITGLVFSSGYWKYVNGFFGFSKARGETESPATSSAWISSPYKGFDNVLMPSETVNGVKRLLSSPVAKKKNLKVLNMSELTPLALELNYVPLTQQPLWYHLNIGMFQKEVDEFCVRVKNKEYDLVLFEDIPDLTHFYPYQVRDSLRQHYHLQDKFLAPRKLENSTIEVYVK